MLGRDRAVSRATCYGLAGRPAQGSNPGVGARFSAPVQTSPGAYRTSYTMGTGSFWVVKWPGRGVDHPPSSSAEVKERVELYFYSPYGPSWPVLGRSLPLPLQTYFADQCVQKRSESDTSFVGLVIKKSM